MPSHPQRRKLPRNKRAPSKDRNAGTAQWRRALVLIFAFLLAIGLIQTLASRPGIGSMLRGLLDRPEDARHGPRKNETAPRTEAGPGAERRVAADAGPARIAKGANDAAPADAIDPFPWHAVAFHFHATVYEKPDAASKPLGYVRRGSAIRVGPKVDGPGCRSGWRASLGGGFVCPQLGFKVGQEPQTFEPSPAPARIEETLPYRYAYATRDDTLEFWRIPNPEEEQEVASLLEAIRAAEAAASASRQDTNAAGQRPGGDAGVPEPDIVPQKETEAMAPLDEAGDAGVEETGPTLPDYVHVLLAKGFFVSLDREVEDAGRRFWRTVRGRVVAASRLGFQDAPAFRGIQLDPDNGLPVAFVMKKRARLFQRQPDGRMTEAGPVPRLSGWRIASTLIRKKRTYLDTGANGFLTLASSRLVSGAEPPQGLGPGEKWVAIRLSDQTLVAYEGDQPVYATLISSGREGFETPTGEFRIWSKHVSITMDDPQAGAEAYSIEDVPWTLYFSESFALHGAFWHHGFGAVRSHGCVNLAPSDARWLFFWSDPVLPPGWHGVSATRGSPGTRIVIRE